MLKKIGQSDCRKSAKQRMEISIEKKTRKRKFVKLSDGDLSFVAQIKNDTYVTYNNATRGMMVKVENANPLKIFNSNLCLHLTLLVPVTRNLQ